MEVGVGTVIILQMVVMMEELQNDRVHKEEEGRLPVF